MVPYLLFYIFILSGTIISFQNIDRKSVTFFFVFLAFLFFLLIGFRFCGYDYLSYLEVYESIKEGNDVFGMEPGFATLCSFSPSFRILLIIMALFTMLLHSFFIYKTSDLPIFSLFLLSSTLLLPTFMGQFRQGVAIGFVAFAFYYYNNKKYYLYLLFVVLAALFHYSALISLFFLFVPRNIKSFKYYFITTIVSIFSFQFFQPILFKIIDLIPNLAVADRLLFYSENDDVKLGFNTAILIRIFVVFLCYYYRTNIKSIFFPLMLNVYHLSIIFYLIIGPIIPQLGGRGALYFSYFDIILITFIIRVASGFNQYLLIFLFFLLTLLRIFQFFHDDFNYECYVPYLKFYNF